MAKNSLFRNSLGGYNKDDVNNYIASLGVQYADRESELEGEIKALKSELEVLPALRAEKQKAESLAFEVQTLKKENEDLTNSISAQGQELEIKKEELSKTFAEKQVMTERCTQLEERLAKLEDENAKMKAEIEFKNAKIEKVEEECRLNAASLEEEKRSFERRAEEMLSLIQMRAKEVIDKANETAQLIVSNAKKKADTIDTAPVSPVSAEASKKKDSLSDMLDNHMSKMDAFFSNIARSLRGDGK